jgi:hypothetical protein
MRRLRTKTFFLKGNDGNDRKSSSLTVFYLALHNNSAPPAAFHTHIEAARSFEAHLVRVNTGHEEFACREDETGCGSQGINADPVGRPFGEEVARPVEAESIALFMLAATTMRVHHLENDRFVREQGGLREDIDISRVFHENFHFLIGIIKMFLDRVPRSFINFHHRPPLLPKKLECS